MASVLGHYVLWVLGLAEAQTQLTSSEQQALASCAADRKCCMEIGVWHGVNTRRIREAMSPAGMLYAVDPFPPGRLGFSVQRRIALAEVSKSFNGKVEFIRKTSVETAGDWQCPLDFLFIDGDHSYEGLRQDWNAWAPHVMAGGLVCLHDSCSSKDRNIDHAGSVRFTRDVILNDARFSRIDAVDTLTVLRRSGDSA